MPRTSFISANAQTREADAPVLAGETKSWYQRQESAVPPQWTYRCVSSPRPRNTGTGFRPGVQRDSGSAGSGSFAGRSYGCMSTRRGLKSRSPHALVSYP
jgi:hypothetical protein